MTEPASRKIKIICVVGPTSSGKSELAVMLAKKHNGEIVSADSRQVYRGLDLGTGKVEGAWKHMPPPASGAKPAGHGRLYVYKGIPHYCIDTENPRRQYSVARFKVQAERAIRHIARRGKVPILCGGTGHFMDAVVFNQAIPEVKPNQALRRRLNGQTADQLYRQLSGLDPARAASIDSRNKRRLIRALEIVMTTGKPVPLTGRPAASPYEALWIGIAVPREELYQKIDRRLRERLRQGMEEEVSGLHRSGLSWRRLEQFGLEYKFISLCLQNKLSRDDMVSQLSFAIKHYSKRQLTWWKQNKNIRWIAGPNQAQALVREFLQD